MENIPQNKPERIVSKEELLEIISRFAPHAVVVKETTDDKGVSFLELKAEGEKEGTFTEIDYRRDKHNMSRDGVRLISIHMTSYEDDMPFTGNEIRLCESESGEWVETDKKV